MNLIFFILIGIILISLFSGKKETFNQQKYVYPTNNVCYLANNDRRCCKYDHGFSKQICLNIGQGECKEKGLTWCDLQHSGSSVPQMDEPAVASETDSS